MAQISWFAPSEDPRKHKFGVVADNASIGGGGAVKEPGHFEAGAPTGFFPGESIGGSGWGGYHTECGARSYNGGLGAEPLVRGPGRQKPP